jgi:hypothetical protein
MRNCALARGPELPFPARVVCWFIVAKGALFCHKRDLHRPAEQGLPWRWSFGLFDLRKT